MNIWGLAAQAPTIYNKKGLEFMDRKLYMVKDCMCNPVYLSLTPAQFELVKALMDLPVNVDEGISSVNPEECYSFYEDFEKIDIEVK